MFKDLWEIEGAICSYIYDMQQEHTNASYKSIGYVTIRVVSLISVALCHDYKKAHQRRKNLIIRKQFISKMKEIRTSMR